MTRSCTASATPPRRASSEHRETGLHRLEQRDREGLPGGRQDEQVQCHQVGAPCCRRRRSAPRDRRARPCRSPPRPRPRVRRRRRSPRSRLPREGATGADQRQRVLLRAKDGHQTREGAAAREGQQPCVGLRGRLIAHTVVYQDRAPARAQQPAPERPSLPVADRHDRPGPGHGGLLERQRQAPRRRTEPAEERRAVRGVHDPPCPRQGAADEDARLRAMGMHDVGRDTAVEGAQAARGREVGRVRAAAQGQLVHLDARLAQPPETTLSGPVATTTRQPRAASRRLSCSTCSATPPSGGCTTCRTVPGGTVATIRPASGDGPTSRLPVDADRVRNRDAAIRGSAGNSPASRTCGPTSRRGRSPRTTRRPISGYRRG